MSKTNKDALYEVNRREEQLYNDKYGKLKGVKKYQRARSEKKLKNALRSNDINKLIHMDS